MKVIKLLFVLIYMS